MKEYIVTGHANVICSMKVKARSGEEAIKIANEEFGELTNYVGMGGTEHLIGVLTTEDERRILVDSEPEFDDYMEADNEGE